MSKNRPDLPALSTCACLHVIYTHIFLAIQSLCYFDTDVKSFFSDYKISSPAAKFLSETPVSMFTLNGFNKKMNQVYERLFSLILMVHKH